MRIVYVYGSTPLRHGDIRGDMAEIVKVYGDWVGDTAAHVAALGHEVHLFFMHKHISGTVVDRGVTWHAYKPLITHRKLVAGKEPCPAMIREVFRIGPDVIHYQTISYPINYAWYAREAKKRGVPLVAQQHHGGAFPRRFWDAAAQRYGLRTGDMAIFQTEEVRESYLDHYKLDAARTTVIPVGYNERFQQSDKTLVREKTGLSGNPVILWVAYLHQRKDPLTLVEAFDRITDRFPDARLYMIGSGDLEDTLTQRISVRSELKERVKLLGFIHNQNLPDYMNAADIYVLCSHAEAWGITILEAMACGNVPVVTDLAPSREMTDNGRYGLLFPPGNVCALENHLTKLLTNPELLHSMATQAASRAANYTWEASARRLTALYERMAAR